MRARHRHFNPGHAGATLALDSRFIVGAADASQIDTWVGRSGTSINATSTSTARPTYKSSEINGQPMVNFDGSNDTMTATLSSSNPCTVLSALYLTEDRVQFRVAWSIGTNVLALGYNNTNQLYVFTSTGITVSRSRPTNIEILGCVVNGASSLLLANGIATSGTIASHSASNFRLCHNGLSNFSPGFAGCFIYIPSALEKTLYRRLEHAAAFSFKIACS
jgi:hypothetical protein